MHRLMSAIAGLEALDSIGERLGKLVRDATKPKPLKEPSPT
jgi:hypothetical protein